MFNFKFAVRGQDIEFTCEARNINSAIKKFYKETNCNSVVVDIYLYNRDNDQYEFSQTLGL